MNSITDISSLSFSSLVQTKYCRAKTLLVHRRQQYRCWWKDRLKWDGISSRSIDRYLINRQVISRRIVVSKVFTIVIENNVWRLVAYKSHICSFAGGTPLVPELASADCWIRSDLLRAPRLVKPTSSSEHEVKCVSILQPCENRNNSITLFFSKSIALFLFF